MLELLRQTWGNLPKAGIPLSFCMWHNLKKINYAQAGDEFGEDLAVLNTCSSELVLAIWESLSCCVYCTCRDGTWHYGDTSTLACVPISRVSKGLVLVYEVTWEVILLTQASALLPRHKAFTILPSETRAQGGQGGIGDAVGTWVVGEMLEHLKQHLMPGLYSITQAPASWFTEKPPTPLGLLCWAGEVGHPVHVVTSTFRTLSPKSTSLPPARVFISRALVSPLGQKRNADVICPNSKLQKDANLMSESKRLVSVILAIVGTHLTALACSPVLCTETKIKCMLDGTTVLPWRLWL